MPTGTRGAPAGFTRRAAYPPRSWRITSARTARRRGAGRPGISRGTSGGG